MGTYMSKKITKILAIMSLILILTACGSEEEKSTESLVATTKSGENDTKETDTTIEKVTEEETTLQVGIANSIGIYIYNDAQGIRQLVKEHYSKWVQGQDIVCYEVLASKDEQVVGTYFKDMWESLWNECFDSKDYKIGYFLEIELEDGEKISKMIRTPNDIDGFTDYVEAYMYDDYHQTRGVWYTHLSEPDMNEDTMCTSIKLTAGSKISQIKQMWLTAYVYTSDKDFDNLTGLYVGNNSYKILIGKED